MANVFRTDNPLILPYRPKYRRITAAFYKVIPLAAAILYFVAIEAGWARIVVFYLWKVSPLGLFTKGTPYGCGYDDWTFCPAWAPFFDGSESISFHPAFFAFVLGLFGTVRVFTFMLEKLEIGLRVDFISRVIDYFLPKSKGSGKDHDK